MERIGSINGLVDNYKAMRNYKEIIQHAVYIVFQLSKLIMQRKENDPLPKLKGFYVHLE